MVWTFFIIYRNCNTDTNNYNDDNKNNDIDEMRNIY